MAGVDGVVVHLDEADESKQSTVLGNIEHLRGELGADTPVELVAHGPGIGACLATGGLAGRVADLVRQGVVVAACENTMRSRDITPDRLVDGVVTVPAGVAEVVRKQRDGWSYVRP